METTTILKMATCSSILKIIQVISGRYLLLLQHLRILLKCIATKTEKHTPYIGNKKEWVYPTLFSVSKLLLCHFPQAGFDNVCQTGDKLAIGRLAPAGGDGIAEIFVQHIDITPDPGHLDEMPDGTPKIPFIGILVA